MSMKITSKAWLRCIASGVLALTAFTAVQAASITHDGINYTTSGTKATVAKYTIIRETKDTIFYEGDIVIPATFEHEGVTYTVVATAANSFLDCRDLTSLVLPETCVTIGRNSFKGCTSLKVSPIPVTATTFGNGIFNGCTSLEEITIPYGWTKMVSEDLSGCPIKRLIYADTETPIETMLDAFGKTSESQVAVKTIEEIYFGRPVDATKYTNAQQPFHNMTALRKVTFGGHFTTIAGTMFQGCSALKEVVFNEGNMVNSIGDGAFRSCASLETIALPEAVTTVAANVFNNCTLLKNVTLGSGVTSIGVTAFYKTGLQTIALPDGITTIGQSAFSGSKLTEIVLPSALTAIGSQAFANTRLAAVTIPAGVTSIGNAAFAPIASLKSVTVAEGNENFKVENGVLLSADGKRALVVASQAEGLPETLEMAGLETIDNYGFYKAPFTAVNLPALTSIGQYAFNLAAIEDFTLKANVNAGIFAFAGSALKNIVIEEGRNDIVQGLCQNCTQLATVSLPTTATGIMLNAFGGCTALETMTLPNNVNYMEAGAVPATIKALRVLNPNTPALAAGVFSATQSDVECKVAATSVDKFKAAPQWTYLNIVGDPTIEGGNAALGCPTGLYFATTDGKLMYKDENGEVIDTKFNAGEHAFTLQSYKNRIYVAVAGHNYTYQDPNQPLGDGELFYVNNSNGIFYRVTVLNNVGYAPSEDPFSMYIDSLTNKIYISDRNVGIHEMDADTTGLYGSQPFLLQNQWLPFYNDYISWGSITGGFTIDSNGIFWMSKKFNGLGIIRFKRSDIYPDGNITGKPVNYKKLFADDIIKTIYLDEANGYLYMHVMKDHNGCVPGIYRIALSRLVDAEGNDIEGNDNLKIADCELIDDSPVSREGSGSEASGEVPNVAQITSDGTNIYWAYNAPETDADALTGSTPLDAENPLHKSGIKCIKANAETPVVAFAVEGVKAYGIAGATYVPDVTPQPLKGDVNGDGKVEIDDVNALINILLGKAEATAAANVDGVGGIDVQDVNVLINIILGK